MRAGEPSGPQAERQRGRELVRGWTVAAAVGALGLTGVLGLAAAGTFHGRTISSRTSSSAADATTSQDDSSSQGAQGALAPQAPSGQTFGGGLQPPAVVSGGS
jgi:hypothetical protein